MWPVEIMRVNINKPGHNIQATGINDLFSRFCLNAFCDGHDFSTVDGNIKNITDAGFRINYIAAFNNNVIVLRKYKLVLKKETKQDSYF